ncbi:hypothetical protein [Burkholderia glumae]|uniref:hypothetical protein n=1 Tax=Burkholderia glumae TaxID=337 RepID=UPI0020B3890D|nr:hypothetical protein [Burkholderia glumae]
MMLRWLIAILLVANLVALAAIEGLFGPPPAAGAREPAHLAQQVRPEALRVSAAAQAAETPVVGGPITSPAIEVQPLGASAPNAASGSGPASEAAGASGRRHPPRRRHRVRRHRVRRPAPQRPWPPRPLPRRRRLARHRPPPTPRSSTAPPAGGRRGPRAGGAGRGRSRRAAAKARAKPKPRTAAPRHKASRA